MTEPERGADANLFPAKAGERLRTAREARGLSLGDVAARTRIPLRHLEAIETSGYTGLPSPTYAVGFARAYARTVEADEVGIAAQVRDEVAQLGQRTPQYEPYATADPDRVPSRGVAIVAAGIAVALVVLALLWFGTSWWQASRGAPDQPIAAAPTAAALATPAPAAAPTDGQVRLTAIDEVWLRVYDAANRTLFTGTLEPGQFFDVPGDADHPEINVGRPDKLQVTLNGTPIKPLGTGERPIKDVAVDGPAIAARLAAGGPGTPLATPTPAAPTPASPTPTATPTGPIRTLPRPALTSAPRTGDARETARANRRSERAAASGAVPPAPTPSPSPSAAP